MTENNLKWKVVVTFRYANGIVHRVRLVQLRMVFKCQELRQNIGENLLYPFFKGSGVRNNRLLLKNRVSPALFPNKKQKNAYSSVLRDLML